MAPLDAETCLTALTTSTFSPICRPFVVNAVRRVGHNANCWKDDSFRKIVLNATVWIARAEVPAGGVPSKTPTDEELNAYLK
jgi:hypothetical protein